MRIQPLITLLSLLIFFGSMESFAQTIEINTRRATEIYEVNSTIIKRKELKQRMASDQASLNKFVGGQAWTIGGIATSASGGVILLAGVGLAVENSIENELLWASEKVDDSLSRTLMGVGVAALVPGIIMILQGRSQRIKAVRQFNQTVDGSAFNGSVQLRPSSNGIGIVLAF